MKIEDYRRFASHEGLRMLINDLCVRGYSGFNIIAIVRDDEVVYYIPELSIKQTSREGIDLYSSRKKFLAFAEGFRNLTKKLKNSGEKILSSNPITRELIKEFFDLCVEFIKEYRKTEFVSVDAPYLELQKNPVPELKANLKDYETVKFEFRDYMNHVFMGTQGYWQKVLEKLSKQFNISNEDIQQYTMDEVFALFDGKKIDKQIVKERFQRNIIFEKDGHRTYKWGKEADVVIKDFLKEENKGKISGTIVNKGRVRGIARIIKPGWHEDFTRIKEAMERMNKGDILVSETTSPDIMVAIRKAGAIVTDQGGLMSHAAIMSREMNVPGIVGCGNATKLIKDGDLIEVDANKGVVEIIKRAEN